MPSPVSPSQICATIPAANADLCVRLTRFFSALNLLCDWFTYAFNEDGTWTDQAKTDITNSVSTTGDFKFSATLNVGVGWLLCNGAAVSRTTYAALFAQVGTRYGAGDGLTTFNLPDGRGRSLMGAGAGVTPSALTNRDINIGYYGEESTVLTVANLPSHHHVVHSFSAGATGGDGGDILNEPDPGADHDHDTDDTGGNQAHNTVHPVLIGYLFIKT